MVYIIYRRFYLAQCRGAQCRGAQDQVQDQISDVQLICITTDLLKIPYKKIFLNHLKDLYDLWPEVYSQFAELKFYNKHQESKLFNRYKHVFERTGVYFILSYKNSDFIDCRIQDVLSPIYFRYVYKMTNVNDLIKEPLKIDNEVKMKKLLQSKLPNDLILLIKGMC